MPSALGIHLLYNIYHLYVLSMAEGIMTMIRVHSILFIVICFACNLKSLRAHGGLCRDDKESGDEVSTNEYCFGWVQPGRKHCHEVYGRACEYIAEQHHWRNINMPRLQCGRVSY